MAATSVPASRIEPDVRDGPASPAVGLCLGCDYPLRDLPGRRCPECGRPFDPGDPTTTNQGLPLGRLGRWVLNPVGWPVIALALALTPWMLWVATAPRLYYMGGSIFVPALACVAVGFVQFAWWGTRSLTLHHLGQPDRMRADDRGRWGLVWKVTAVAVALVLAEVPVRVAFLAHRPAFERLAAEVRANAPSCATLPGRRVGIYTISTAWPAERNGADGATIAIRFEPTAEGGFAYCPNGPEELRYNPGNHGRLWGDWYWFSED